MLVLNERDGRLWVQSETQPPVSMDAGFAPGATTVEKRKALAQTLAAVSINLATMLVPE